MGAFKWLAGLLGWASWGPIGGLLGYLAGAFVEKTIDTAIRLTGGSGPFGSPDPLAGGQASGGSSSGPSSRSSYNSSSRSYTVDEQRNSFMVSLLVLSSAVIKADGRVHPAEVEFALAFVRQNFGEGAVPQAQKILEELNRKDVNVYSVGGQIADNMNYSQRLQLYHYLAQVANADGLFSKEEKDVLEAIASAIRITSSDAASVIAMFYKDSGSAYAVLELSPSASDDDVKKAYRRMAMKYHPDKVSTLGPDVQRAASEKFRQVQEAYETIKRQRGMN